ncbi:MAG: V-type ATP synthase subunit D [Blastococcus sp.]
MPSGLRALPPGRAGRIWLRRRLAVAQRGADLLDRKLRILRVEQQRYRLLTRRTAAAWTDAHREAETWLLRAALVGGERAIRHAAADGTDAEVAITWTATMGVIHPARATCQIPERQITAPTPDNTALVHAVAAYATALRAAVEHAVAAAALRVVDAEVVATRRRVRAIDDRWIPRLTAAQRVLQFALDEQEHDDGVRLRWAASHRRRSATGPEGRRQP